MSCAQEFLPFAPDLSESAKQLSRNDVKRRDRRWKSYSDEATPWCVLVLIILVTDFQPLAPDLVSNPGHLALEEERTYDASELKNVWPRSAIAPL